MDRLLVLRTLAPDPAATAATHRQSRFLHARSGASSSHILLLQVRPQFVSSIGKRCICQLILSVDFSRYIPGRDFIFVLISYFLNFQVNQDV